MQVITNQEASFTPGIKSITERFLDFLNNFNFPIVTNVSYD